MSVAEGFRPAVFLDRDGVIAIPEFRNRRSFAVRRVADFRLYPTAAASLQRLKQAGFVLAVVTNQPDVGRGLVPRSEVDAMHEIMMRELPLDAVRVCFHDQKDNCTCRKPKPGMMLDLATALKIDLQNSFMVGDRRIDIEAGRAAGCKTVFIDLDYDEPKPSDANHIVQSIAEATDAIIRNT